MTQEEKAKAYDKALERARAIINDYEERGLEEILFYAKEDLGGIFPELKESEDERIRKNIISWLKNIEGQTISINDYNSAIAWLEKQGEPYTKRDVDDAFVEGMALAKDELEKQGEKNLANSAKTCKKSQRMVSAEAKETLYDKPAWSEEDEEMLDGIILRCEKYGHQEQINWLKSLKERIGG